MIKIFIFDNKMTNIFKLLKNYVSEIIASLFSCTDMMKQSYKLNN